MIIDYLENLPLYSAMPVLQAGMAFLSKCPTESSPRQTIAPGVSATVTTYETVEDGQRKWEAHDHLIDIHCVLQGEERIEWANRRELTYSGSEPGKDVLRFSGQGVFITLRPGMFCVLFPEDAHKTKLASGATGTVVKAILKIDC